MEKFTPLIKPCEGFDGLEGIDTKNGEIIDFDLDFFSSLVFSHYKFRELDLHCRFQEKANDSTQNALYNLALASLVSLKSTVFDVEEKMKLMEGEDKIFALINSFTSLASKKNKSEDLIQELKSIASKLRAVLNFSASFEEELVKHIDSDRVSDSDYFRKTKTFVFVVHQWYRKALNVLKKELSNTTKSKNRFFTIAENANANKLSWEDEQVKQTLAFCRAILGEDVLEAVFKRTAINLQNEEEKQFLQKLETLSLVSKTVTFDATFQRDFIKNLFDRINAGIAFGVLKNLEVICRNYISCSEEDIPIEGCSSFFPFSDFENVECILDLTLLFSRENLKFLLANEIELFLKDFNSSIVKLQLMFIDPSDKHKVAGDKYRAIGELGFILNYNNSLSDSFLKAVAMKVNRSTSEYGNKELGEGSRIKELITKTDYLYNCNFLNQDLSQTENILNEMSSFKNREKHFFLTMKKVANKKREKSPCFGNLMSSFAFETKEILLLKQENSETQRLSRELEEEFKNLSYVQFLQPKYLSDRLNDTVFSAEDLSLRYFPLNIYSVISAISSLEKISVLIKKEYLLSLKSYSKFALELATQFNVDFSFEEKRFGLNKPLYVLGSFLSHQKKEAIHLFFPNFDEKKPDMFAVKFTEFFDSVDRKFAYFIKDSQVLILDLKRERDNISALKNTTLHYIEKELKKLTFKSNNQSLAEVFSKKRKEKRLEQDLKKEKVLNKAKTMLLKNQVESVDDILKEAGKHFLGKAILIFLLKEEFLLNINRSVAFFQTNETNKAFLGDKGRPRQIKLSEFDLTLAQKQLVLQEKVACLLSYFIEAKHQGEDFAKASSINTLSALFKTVKLNNEPDLLTTLAGSAFFNYSQQHFSKYESAYSVLLKRDSESEDLFFSKSVLERKREVLSGYTEEDSLQNTLYPLIEQLCAFAQNNLVDVKVKELNRKKVISIISELNQLTGVRNRSIFLENLKESLFFYNASLSSRKGHEATLTKLFSQQKARREHSFFSYKSRHFLKKLESAQSSLAPLRGAELKQSEFEQFKHAFIENKLIKDFLLAETVQWFKFINSLVEQNALNFDDFQNRQKGNLNNEPSQSTNLTLWQSLKSWQKLKYIALQSRITAWLFKHEGMAYLKHAGMLDDLKLFKNFIMIYGSPTGIEKYLRECAFVEKNNSLLQRENSLIKSCFDEKNNTLTGMSKLIWGLENDKRAKMQDASDFKSLQLHTGIVFLINDILEDLVLISAQNKNIE